ncbi:MAG: PepSY-like domain-containing protein [Paludibacteraceae bacterium]|nr:PepSY-like domain-containing protein [Paludibacteraceae bacterium]
MKKLLIFFMALMSLTAFAKGKQPIAFDKVPQPVQTELQKYFTQDQVQYATFEKALGQKLYTFVLEDGTKIRYNHKAVLRKIENKNGILTTLVPEKIMEYANATFPKATITEYVCDKSRKEIELNNNMELIFNKRCKFLRIED